MWFIQKGSPISQKMASVNWLSNNRKYQFEDLCLYVSFYPKSYHVVWCSTPKEGIIFFCWRLKRIHIISSFLFTQLFSMVFFLLFRKSNIYIFEEFFFFYFSNIIKYQFVSYYFLELNLIILVFISRRHKTTGWGRDTGTILRPT